MSTLTQPGVSQLSRRDLARYIDHTAHNVTLMREVVGPAAGGIKTYADTLAMIAAAAA